MRTNILILGIALATPAMAADQFDLVCTSGKESMHYRLDLSSMEYCFGNCDRVLKVQEATTGMITLYSVEERLPDRSRRYARINRQSGEWEWYSYSPRLSATAMNIKGTCRAEPFSGFPEAKF